ncbi:hypothetical protein RDI58_021447 [Solanum bulbocastanum]|uniref:Uncharacterized protein n=1 Tax=Solanum bulbocastanum TaxID=147425 RepID=A0AAN8Y772_SOLBU
MGRHVDKSLVRKLPGVDSTNSLLWENLKES